MNNIIDILLVGLCICTLGFLYVGLPWMYAKWLWFLLKRKAEGEKALVLTFDDGPGSRMTPAILNLLDKYHAKATFFLCGNAIAGNEDIVRQTAEAGHDIYSHGFDHLHHWKANPIYVVRGIKRGWKTIDTALGGNQGIYPFRPPYGKLNLVSLVYLLIQKVPIVLWTINSGDRILSRTNSWMLKNYDSERTTIEAMRVGGAVVLAHDSNRRNPDTEAFTLECIRSALLMARKTGMKVMSVSQLLNYKQPGNLNTFHNCYD